MHRMMQWQCFLGIHTLLPQLMLNYAIVSATNSSH